MDVASETTELESGEASPEPREGGHEWIQLDSWWTHCRWRGKTTGKAWTCKPPLGAIPNGWTSGFLPRSSRPGDRGHSGRDLGSMGSWRSKRCYSQPEATNGAFRASLRTERSDATFGAPGHTTRNKKLGAPGIATRGPGVPMVFDGSLLLITDPLRVRGIPHTA